MAVQEVLRVFLSYDIDGIEQSLKVAFLNKGSSYIGHDEVADEHGVLIRNVDQHCVVRLSTLNRNQLEARSTDVYDSPSLNRDIRPVGPQILETEVGAEKLLGEDSRRVELPLKFLLVVAPPVEPHVGSQRTEVIVATNVVPVGMGNDYGCQRRKPRGMSAKCVVCRLGCISSCSGINADQLTPVVRDDEVVLRKFKAGESIDPFGQDLIYSFRKERVPIR